MLQNIVEKLVFSQEYRGLKEFGESLQRLEGVGDKGAALGNSVRTCRASRVFGGGDKGLEEPAGSLQSLKGVRDGDKDLEEHGKDLKGLKDSDEARNKLLLRGWILMVK